MNTGAEDERRSTPTLAFSRSSASAMLLAASASRPASARRANLDLKAQYLNDGSELPLPLWERVGVRGSGLSMERNPSPGSHLRCDIAEALLRRSFLRTAAAGGLCSPTRGEVALNIRIEFKFMNRTLQALGDRLIPPDKRSLLSQPVLQ